MPHDRPRRPLSRAFAGVAVLTAALAPGLVAAPPVTAAPVPPTPSELPRAVEALQPYVGQAGCDPVAKPGVSSFSSLLLTTYRDTSTLGIVRDCGVGGASEHKEGRAFDWGASADDPEQAAEVEALLSWLLASDDGEPAVRARRFGIMYIIWDRRIWRAYDPSAGWQPYSGRSPHTDHVHFSFGWNGASRSTSWWTGRVAPVDFGPFRAGGGGGGGGDGAAPPAPPVTEESLPSPVTAFSPAEGVVHLLSRTTSGTATLRTVERGRAGAAEDLGGTLLSEPVAVSREPGSVTTVAQGADDALLVRVALGDAPTPWYRLDGLLTERPAAAAVDARIEVVARGRDGDLWHRTSPEAGDWGPWTSLGLQVRAGAAPALVARPDGRLEVLAVGEDGEIQHRYRARDGEWSDWHGVGGRTADDVSAAATGRSRTTVTVRGTDDRTWVRDLGRRSTGWRPVDGPELAAPPTIAAAPGSDSVTVYAVGADRMLHRVDRDEDGDWNRWSRLDLPDVEPADRERTSEEPPTGAR